MAKAIKKNENVEIVSEGVKLVSGELETKLKNNLTSKKKDEDKVKDLGAISVVMDSQPKPVPEKKVKILMKDNHKCFIGGEWYYLMKDKHYNVPENVKDILMKADKLRPL